MPRLASTLATLLLTTLLAGCFQKNKDVSEYIARAEKFQADGDPAKARVELQNALRIAPADAKLNFAMARSEDEAGNLQAAVPFYLRAAAPDAHLRAAQIRVIDLLLESGRVDDASGRINLMLGSFPNDTDALAFRADAGVRRDQLVEARKDALAAIQKSPTNPRALAVLAQLDLRNKDPQSALRRLDAGLAANPRDIRLLQVRAAALVFSNRPDEALQIWSTIVGLAPKNVLAQSALADLRSQTGHPEDAISRFRAAADSDPANQEMQLAFVNFLAGHGKPADVTAELRGRIKAFPSTNIFDLALAEYHRSNGELQQARDVLAAARERLADAPARRILNGLAKIDAAMGRIDLARTDLKLVLKDDAANEEALLFQATLDQNGGREQAAISGLLDLLRVNPASSPAYNQLAYLYFAQGDKKLAADAMRRAVAVMPGNSDAQMRLASFLQSAGEVSEARSLINQVTLSNADDPQTWSASGRLAMDRKDWDGANYAVSRLRALPGSEAAANTLDGETQAARGDDAAAIQSFKAAFDVEANVDTNLVGHFADSSVKAGRSGEGADFLTSKVDSLRPDKQALVWPAIFTLWADAGNSDRAMDAFHHAAALRPTDIDLYGAAAQVLVARGRFDQARQILGDGMSAGAPKWALMLTMGDVDGAAGLPKKALASYKAASDDNPTNIFAANNYGSLLADLEPQNVTALTDARDRLNGQESSRKSAIVDTIAWLDFRLGRLDEARQLLMRIDAKSSEKPQRRFHLAAVLLASGDKAGGDALLQTVKGTQFPGADEAAALSPS